MNSDPQAWQQAPLSAEPSCKPHFFKTLNSSHALHISVQLTFILLMCLGGSQPQIIFFWGIWHTYYIPTFFSIKIKFHPIPKPTVPKTVKENWMLIVPVFQTHRMSQVSLIPTSGGFCESWRRKCSPKLTWSCDHLQPLTKNFLSTRHIILSSISLTEQRHLHLQVRGWSWHEDMPASQWC